MKVPISRGRDSVERVLEVIGVGRLELDPVPRARVVEAQAHRVQPLPLQPEPLGQRRIGAVQQVADAGMVQGAQVDADLVGAPGLELDREQAREAVRLERVVVRDARPAVGPHGELEVVLGVPRDRCVDRAGVRIGVALHERVVRLVDRAGAERLLEHRVRMLGLGDGHQAAGADVEPLHDALALGRAGRRDPHAGAGEVADDRRPGPPDAGCAATPTGLSTTTMSSSWNTMRMPSTGSATTVAVRGAGMEASRSAPA